MALPDAKKLKLDNKYGPTALSLDTYEYNEWLENEESTDLPPMSLLRGSLASM